MCCLDEISSTFDGDSDDDDDDDDEDDDDRGGEDCRASVLVHSGWSGRLSFTGRLDELSLRSGIVGVGEGVIFVAEDELQSAAAATRTCNL